MTRPYVGFSDFKNKFGLFSLDFVLYLIVLGMLRENTTIERSEML
jgi:hypothetical protein